MTRGAAWLSDAEFKAPDPELRARFAEVARELSEPFGFALSQGKVQEIRLRPGASRFTSSIARTRAASGDDSRARFPDEGLLPPVVNRAHLRLVEEPGRRDQPVFRMPCAIPFKVVPSA
jgi:hypothetical protein